GRRAAWRSCAHLLQALGEHLAVDLVRVEAAQLLDEGLAQGADREGDAAVGLAGLADRHDAAVWAVEDDRAARGLERDARDRPGATPTHDLRRAPQPRPEPRGEQVERRVLRLALDDDARHRLVRRLVERGGDEAAPQRDARPREVRVARA